MFSLVVIIGLLLNIAWHLVRTKTVSTSRIVDVCITCIVVALLGRTLPWNSDLSVFWWYALVAMTALYAGKVAFRRKSPKSPAAKKSPKSPKSPVLR